MAKTNALFIALSAMVFAAIHFAGARAIADDSTTQPSATQADATGIPVIGADALRAAYINNAFRADSVYGHGAIDVKGVVKGVALGVDKGPIIGLCGTGQMVVVTCAFSADDKSEILDPIKSLNAGDSIVVLCEVLHVSDGIVRTRGLCIDPQVSAK